MKLSPSRSSFVSINNHIQRIDEPLPFPIDFQSINLADRYSFEFQMKFLANNRKEESVTGNDINLEYKIYRTLSACVSFTHNRRPPFRSSIRSTPRNRVGLSFYALIPLLINLCGPCLAPFHVLDVRRKRARMGAIGSEVN